MNTKIFSQGALLLFLSFFLYLPLSNAQNLSPAQEMVVKNALLEIEMLNITTKLKSPEETISLYLSPYERLVASYCFPNIDQTLKHDPQKVHPECNKYKDKVAEMVQNSPLVICADHGIESSKCKLAYDDQYIDKISRDTFAAQDSLLLDAELARARNSDVRYTIESEIGIAKNEFNNANEHEKHEKGEIVAQKLDKLLQMDCGINTVRAQKEIPNERLKYKLREREVSEKDSLYDVYKKLDQALDETKNEAAQVQTAVQELITGEATFEQRDGFTIKKPEFEPIWRIRYLPQHCFESIKLGREFDARYPTAICYYQGELSPECIFAKRWLLEVRQAINRAKQQPEVKVPQKGLATF